MHYAEPASGAGHEVLDTPLHTVGSGITWCIPLSFRVLANEDKVMELTNFQDKYGLTVHEAVKVLGICERKVRELIAQDELPHFRVGRSVRIPWQPLKEWMDKGGTEGDKQ